MPFEQGHSKLGGRQKGTANKRNQEIQDLAKELNCNPAKILMHFAMGDFEALGYQETIMKTSKSGDSYEEYTISPELRKSSAADLMPYLHGKRKPVDSEGNDANDPLTSLVEAIRGN